MLSISLKEEKNKFVCTFVFKNEKKIFAKVWEIKRIGVFDRERCDGLGKKYWTPIFTFLFKSDKGGNSSSV